MSALLLRIIACVAMLIDHIGYGINSMPMRAIGRIAFPIFVFLICNGYRHTSSRLRYAGRLAVFAIVSQIPFSLFLTNRFTYATGNVFLTLLIALLCIWATDEMRKNKVGRWLCWIPAAVACILYQMEYIRSDYGGRGIVISMIFFFFNGREWWKRALTVLACFCAVFYDYSAALLINSIWGREITQPAVDMWTWMQLYSLLALPLIFLYNGKKGVSTKQPLLSKLMQYSFYLFYPLHMLLIWFVRRL